MKWLHGYGEGKGSVKQLLFFPLTRSSLLHEAVPKAEERD